jgi:hyaluronan synthase
MPNVSASPSRFYESLIKAGIFSALCAIVFLAITSGSFDRFYGAQDYNIFSHTLVFILFFYSSISLLYLAVRGILCFLYHPFAPNGDDLPTVSVLIPAYNEGECVRKSICSVIDCDYPKHLLEIIIVDDGSRDDTWKYIEQERLLHPDLVTTFRFKKNRGKKKALALGFRKARGEVIVTVDSDSVIDKNALRNIVAPFVDPHVGAVTGKIRAVNRGSNLLTRMLNVQYIMGTEFYRSSQSVFRTVMCCAGALSAYRRIVIEKVLDGWLTQKFLGQECTYGEDHALTNHILRSGSDTVYQRTAIIYTAVPETLRGFMRMFTRWNKGYLRESIVFLTFMLTKYRERNRVLPVCEFAFTFLMLPFQFLIVGYAAYCCTIDPILVLRFLAAVSLITSLYMLFYIRFEKNSDFVYGLLYGYLYIFLGIWLLPYAALTMRNNSWLTR